MSKYDVILFDFGNVFINLDTNSTKTELQKLGLTEFTKDMVFTNHQYERGLISTTEFLNFYKSIFTHSSEKQLINAWNKILLDFPLERLLFIENFAKNNKCMLLSNINDLHLLKIIEKVGKPFYNRFIACFEKIYYSHEIHMRKPDLEIYEHVLNDNNIISNRILFIDDLKENTDAAVKLGFNIWNINPLTDNIINLTQHTE